MTTHVTRGVRVGRGQSRLEHGPAMHMAGLERFELLGHWVADWESATFFMHLSSARFRYTLGVVSQPSAREQRTRPEPNLPSGELAEPWISFITRLLATPTSMVLDPTIPAAARRLLGPEGVQCLGKLLGDIQTAAPQRGWPIRRAEVVVEVDPEAPASETVELVLHLSTDADQGETVLAEVYGLLEESIRRFEPHLREKLLGTLFFAIETA